MIIFEIGGQRAPFAVGARAEPPSRDTRQIAEVAFQLGTDIVAEDRDTEIGCELVADFAVDAGELGIGRRIADQAKILEPVERVGEDVVVEILMIGADGEGGRACLLAECQEVFPSTVLAEDFLAYTVD